MKQMLRKTGAILLACSMLSLAACSSLLGGSVFGSGSQTSQSGAQNTQAAQGSTQNAAQGDMQTTQSGSESESAAEETTEISALNFPTVTEAELIDSGTLYNGSTDVYITQSGVYRFSGSFHGTTITVNVDKDADEGTVYLVLDGVSITSDDSTPLYIIEAEEVVVYLTEGSENTIIQGAVVSSDEAFPSAALYSKTDILFTGSGSLTIDTLYNDGINARDDMMIDGGTYVIRAVGDGISVEDTLQIDSGDITVSAGGGYVQVLNSITVGEGSSQLQATDMLETSMKAIKAMDFLFNGGSLTLSAYEDTINVDHNMIVNGGIMTMISGDDGITVDYALTINDGDITVEYAYEGIEAAYLTIHGGNISVTVLDDALNGNGDAGLLLVTGGSIYLECQGDGMDANNDLTITGGDFVIEVNAIYTGGDGAIDVSGTSTITGGTFVDASGNTVDTSGSMGGKQSLFSGSMQGQGNMQGQTQMNNNTQRR